MRRTSRYRISIDKSDSRTNNSRTKYHPINLVHLQQELTQKTIITKNTRNRPHQDRERKRQEQPRQTTPQKLVRTQEPPRSQSKKTHLRNLIEKERDRVGQQPPQKNWQRLIRRGHQAHQRQRATQKLTERQRQPQPTKNQRTHIVLRQPVLTRKINQQPKIDQPHTILRQQHQPAQAHHRRQGRRNQTTTRTQQQRQGQ